MADNFSVSVTISSVPSVHRSLFHPLATLRHKIWPEPEKRQKLKKGQTNQFLYQQTQTQTVSN